MAREESAGPGGAANMSKKRRTRARGKAEKKARYIRAAILLSSLLLIIVPIMNPLSYKLEESSLVSCLVPYTKLSLVLEELNDTLGARQLVIIYTPCQITSCSTNSRTLSIPIETLRNKSAQELSIGRGVLDNILLEIRTGETIPPSRITSTGEHGSALLFTWSYPALRAILYVSLESKKAVLSIKEARLSQYKPPQDCKLLRLGNSVHTNSDNTSDVYTLECKDNIYSKPLKFTRRVAPFTLEQIAIKDYYCPGTSTKTRYINVSPILILAGILLALVTIRAELRRRHRAVP